LIDWLIAVPPKLQKPGNAQQTLTVGQRVSLLCSVVEGDEPIVMLWHKDDAQLPASLGTEVNQVGHDSILRINRLTAEHMGNYSCRAANFAGSAAVFFFVQVKGTSARRNLLRLLSNFLVYAQNIRQISSPS
jgi:Immunoglobulin domain